MERICREKKDAELVIKFNLWKHYGYGLKENVELSSFHSPLDAKSEQTIGFDLMKVIIDMIEESTDKINASMVNDYNQMSSDLQASRDRFSAIQDKWWFRLFNRK